jgi:hypothetical protein
MTGHGLRLSAARGHELEGHPPVLLRLDAVGADEVGLLALHLHGQESRQHESQKCDDDQQLRQAESALVTCEREHGLHLWAMSMVTIALFVAPSPVAVDAR